MGYDKYVSPLSERYARKEMQHRRPAIKLCLVAPEISYSLFIIQTGRLFLPEVFRQILLPMKSRRESPVLR